MRYKMAHYVMCDTFEEEEMGRLFDEVEAPAPFKIREQVQDSQDLIVDKFNIEESHANGTRIINTAEAASLKALICYQANIKNCSPFVVELAIQDEFRVDDLRDIQARNYYKVVEFLVSWNGVN